MRKIISCLLITALFICSFALSGCQTAGSGDENTSGWTCKNGTFSEENGKVTLIPPEGQSAYALLGDEPGTDYCIDAELNVPKRGNAGIIFGASEEADTVKGYAVLLSAYDQTICLTGIGAEDHIGIRKYSSISTESVQKLRIEVSGAVVRVTLFNDADGVEPWPEFEVEIPEISGKIGVFSDRGEIGGEIALTKDRKIPAVSGETYQNFVCYGYADPDVLYYDGTYYLYATSYRYGEGYEVYTSKDLVNWEFAQNCAVSEDICGEGGFWAPDVEYINGKFYMVVTSDMSLSIAVSDSPLGPFVGLTGSGTEFLTPGIDGHLFVDDDGRIYLYYAGVYAAEMSPDLTTMISGPRELFSARQSYEKNVVEAPYMLKHNGLYYLVYSANDCQSPDYCVCYAVSESPTGPFRKYEDNPVMIRSGDQRGTAHCSFVPSPDGSELFIVYHCHESAEQMGTRSTCIDRARFAPTASGTDILEIYGPTSLPQPYPSSGQ